MNTDKAKQYCLTKPGAYEDYPFDNVTPVIKVNKKMFALFNEKGSVSLKCDPLLSGNLRREHSAITPGYHLNKEHWNTIIFDSATDSIADETVFSLIDLSYELVTKPKRKRCSHPDEN